MTKPGSRGPRRRTDARTDSRGPGRRSRPRGRGPQDWFAEQLVLVLSGQRPVHVLLGHARAPAYEQLSALAPHAPLRPPPGGRAPAVGGVGVCRPSDEAIEAFARISAGERTRALAFRLERRPGDGRWQCCAVELDTVP
ncbi:MULTISPECIES: Rv3235 family protein [unclassified Streptomyces]|uniref:Rv3235 family protein n=1 Tax=Streptomyces johnsoniae TaxID=3075532 RepID=A0ABU2S939_9ACTN|nr:MULTISPECIES: Rv3235 family protein [unclassified Streptomyces]MDT0445465.1 Rv3235 family protein [Streptomyces sp. DSM 41886]ONK13922.1 hypothetical protein STBA_46980 [Streptomyces sp. MP131-18]